MEVNRDEAERCIDIALSALKGGDVDRAEKFIKKAESLYSTQKSKEIAELIQRTRKIQSNGGGNQPRKRKTLPTKPTDAGERVADYTKEQLEIVRKIQRCKDYYEVLSVTKESTDSDIKKAYKKLALQLHPDKNNAPGASEAFKTVGNAVAVLTDSEKRKAYDLYGMNGQNGSTQSYHQYAHQHHHHHHEHSSSTSSYSRNSFESDYTAEELFNMFFGNGFPQQRQHPASANGRRYNQHRHESVQPSLALGLILLLIVVSMLSSFFTTDPVYSLTQTTKYSLRRHTMHLNIPYYVKEKFETEYQGSVARLENSVEDEYIMVMKQSCFRERTYRELMMARAKGLSSKVYMDQAQDLKTPSCENLARIGFSKYNQY